MTEIFLENQEVVQLISGKPCTTSRIVASIFSKEHKHVLRDIKYLECSLEFAQSNFGPSYYINTQNKQQPEYIITRDGFSFLAMGFTGKEAATFKEKFIAAFNKMENQLRPPIETRQEFLLRAHLMLVQDLEESQIALVEEKKITAIQGNLIVKLEPKARYTDTVLQSEDAITTSLVASDLSMTARTLNLLLNEMKFIRKMDKTWILRSEHMGQGYTKTRTKIIHHKNGTVSTKVYTVWTEKGRAYIFSKLHPDSKVQQKALLQLAA